MTHTCHWPGCERPVPPRLWGCKPHWLALPQQLRDLILKTYRPGQEITKTPSREYIDAARTVQDWIALSSNRTTRPMLPALSIRQPWAWLIVNGYKDIENRDWQTAFRGRVLVHAGQTLTRPYYREVVEHLQEAAICPQDLPGFEEMKAMTGGIVGMVRITDCVANSLSPWFMEGGYGFVLAEAQTMTFKPWKGRLGFFNVPESTVQLDCKATI
jgi:hypothetical protein